MSRRCDSISLRHVGHVVRGETGDTLIARLAEMSGFRPLVTDGNIDARLIRFGQSLAEVLAQDCTSARSAAAVRRRVLRPAEFPPVALPHQEAPAESQPTGGRQQRQAVTPDQGCSPHAPAAPSAPIQAGQGVCTGGEDPSPSERSYLSKQEVLETARRFRELSQVHDYERALREWEREQAKPKGKGRPKAKPVAPGGES